MKLVFAAVVFFAFTISAHAQSATFGKGFGARPSEFAPHGFRLSKTGSMGTASRFSRRQARLGRNAETSTGEPAVYALSNPLAPKVRIRRIRTKPAPAAFYTSFPYTTSLRLTRPNSSSAAYPVPTPTRRPPTDAGALPGQTF